MIGYTIFAYEISDNETSKIIEKLKTIYFECIFYETIFWQIHIILK